ncbi:MAG: LytR family transcriptional regulator [Ruminococcaceae bacterium]|nr:LytR family transcriptional regulator [Oscillospiraceae bacterium]
MSEFEKNEMNEDKDQSPDEKPQKKKKRRFPIWARVVCIILAVILLLFGALVVFIYSKLNKINKYDPDSVVTIPPEEESFETNDYVEGTIIVEPEDIIWEEDTNTLSSDKIQNILLIGQDTRIEGVTGRSDSMIVLTIDQKNKKIKATSLMRDMYVQIPGYSDNRINTAYVFGGYELLKSTIEKNLGITIDYFAEVDFFAFEKIVDILDGIYIDLNAEEAYALKSWGHRTVEGRNRLDGAAALSYCTMRYVGNSDYDRTQRQRKALSSIYDRLKQTITLPKALKLVDEIFPLITTNLTNGEILELVGILYTMNASGVEQYRIPADGTFTPMYIREMAVLVPDLGACRRYLWEIIYGVTDDGEK